MHIAQPANSLAQLSARVHRMSPFELTALHDLVGLSGSLILGLAATEGVRDGPTLWDLSRIDETWQEEQWGVDVEASEEAERKKSGFLHALRFYHLLQE